MILSPGLPVGATLKGASLTALNLGMSVVASKVGHLALSRSVGII